MRGPFWTSGGYAMRVARSLRLATSLLVAASGAAIAQDSLPDGDWRTINRDAAATRFSPLKDINRSNVTQLTEAWNYPFRSFNSAVPLVVDGTMFFPAGSRIVALDADTGQEKWVYALPAPAAAPAGGAAGAAAGPPAPTASGRGVGYWPGDSAAPARILVMVGNKMLALDAATG